MPARTLGLVAAVVCAGTAGCFDGDDPAADRAAGEREVSIVQPGAPGKPSKTISA